MVRAREKPCPAFTCQGRRPALTFRERLFGSEFFHEPGVLRLADNAAGHNVVKVPPAIEHAHRDHHKNEAHGGLPHAVGRGKHQEDRAQRHHGKDSEPGQPAGKRGPGGKNDRNDDADQNHLIKHLMSHELKHKARRAPQKAACAAEHHPAAYPLTDVSLPGVVPGKAALKVGPVPKHRNHRGRPDKKHGLKSDRPEVKKNRNSGHRLRGNHHGLQPQRLTDLLHEHVRRHRGLAQAHERP